MGLVMPYRYVTRFIFSSLQSRRNKFLLLLGLCFFFYPIVPTLGYLLNLCYMTGGRDATSHKIEMFAKARKEIFYTVLIGDI